MVNGLGQQQACHEPYIEYTPFNSPGKAEIADKKELDILRELRSATLLLWGRVPVILCAVVIFTTFSTVLLVLFCRQKFIYC